MKLYTEEQVMKAMDGFYDSDCTMRDVIDRLTPIELPNYKEQLDRIEELLLSEQAAKRNKFKIGPL